MVVFETAAFLLLVVTWFAGGEGGDVRVRFREVYNGGKEGVGEEVFIGFG